jgi:hypothetical protein
VLPQTEQTSDQVDRPVAREAGHYVTTLSKADQGKQHWQTAA